MLGSAPDSWILYKSYHLLNLDNETLTADDYANALLDYFTALANIDRNSSDLVFISPTRIDEIIERFINKELTYNYRYLYLITLKLSTLIGFGASFTYDSMSNENGHLLSSIDLDKNVTAAVFIHSTDNDAVDLLTIMIVYRPLNYLNYTNNNLLASSIIVIVTQPTTVHINLTLYFTVLFHYPFNGNYTYTCVYWNNSKWNDNRNICIYKGFNSILNIHECSCNHMTTFAMLFLPLTVTQQ
ncbi:unnamed protein product, partial [Didymodactylos carnosus]